MRVRLRVAGILVLLIAAATLAWTQAHPHARRRQLERERQVSAQSDQPVILDGTIEPEVTVPIRAVNPTLIVPLHSWVERGQVIGEGDGTEGAKDLSQARLLVEEARSLSAAAETEVSQLDEELQTAQADESYVLFQWVLADADERKAEGDVAAIDQLFRQQPGNRFDHDTATLARETATVSRAAVESRLDESARHISDLESESLEAQLRLNKAMERRCQAESALQAMERGGRRIVLVAPAKGMIVAPEAEGGFVGIATDTTRLRAYTLIQQRSLMWVRVGDHAVITMDATPAQSFEGLVSGIAGVRTDSVWEPDMMITITVQNPSGMKLVLSCIDTFLY